MLLMDIEQQVKPLSREEKWQLINDVQEMLRWEEHSDFQHLSLSQYPYPLFTPVGIQELAALFRS